MIKEIIIDALNAAKQFESFDAFHEHMEYFGLIDKIGRYRINNTFLMLIL